MGAQAHELARRGRQAPQRSEQADDDSRVVAHVGQHAGAALRGLAGAQMPRKEGPNDQHYCHGGGQILGMEVLRWIQGVRIWQGGTAGGSVSQGA